MSAGPTVSTSAHQYGPVAALAISPDGHRLLLAADHVKLWSLPDGRLEAALIGVTGMAGALDFAPDGRSFTMADELGHVLLVSIENLE